MLEWHHQVYYHSIQVHLNFYISMMKNCLNNALFYTKMYMDNVHDGEMKWQWQFYSVK